MVKVAPPPQGWEYEYEYHLHNGLYSGSVFRCCRNRPPDRLIIEDDQSMWVYRYTLSKTDNPDTPGAYVLESEDEKRADCG
jgi:hypothetical protein